MKFTSILKIIATVSVVMLSACGGGGGDDVSSSASSIQSSQDVSTLVPSLESADLNATDAIQPPSTDLTTGVESSNDDSTKIESANQLSVNNDYHDVITPAGSGISLSNGINSSTCYIHEHFHFSPGIPEQLVSDIDHYGGDLANFDRAKDLPLVARESSIITPGKIWYNTYSNTVYTRNLVQGACSEYKRYLSPPANRKGVVSTPIALGIASIVAISTRIGMVTAVSSINPSLAPVAAKLSACVGGAAGGLTVNLLTGDFSVKNGVASAIAFCVAGYGGAAAAKYVSAAFTPIGAGIVEDATSIGLSGMRYTIEDLEAFAGL